MNQITIKGRISQDIEIRTTATGKTVGTFSVAVNRKYDRDKADFFRCQAWGKTADFISSYFKKGQEILLTGSMQSSQYENKDKIKMTSWDIVVSDVEFCGKNEQQVNNSSSKNAPLSENLSDFEEIDINDDDVPF